MANTKKILLDTPLRQLGMWYVMLEGQWHIAEYTRYSSDGCAPYRHGWDLNGSIYRDSDLEAIGARIQTMDEMYHTAVAHNKMRMAISTVYNMGHAVVIERVQAAFLSVVHDPACQLLDIAKLGLGPQTVPDAADPLRAALEAAAKELASSVLREHLKPAREHIQDALRLLEGRK